MKNIFIFFKYKKIDYYKNIKSSIFFVVVFIFTLLLLSLNNCAYSEFISENSITEPKEIYYFKKNQLKGIHEALENFIRMDGSEDLIMPLILDIGSLTPKITKTWFLTKEDCPPGFFETVERAKILNASKVTSPLYNFTGSCLEDIENSIRIEQYLIWNKKNNLPDYERRVLNIHLTRLPYLIK